MKGNVFKYIFLLIIVCSLVIGLLVLINDKKSGVKDSSTTTTTVLGDDDSQIFNLDNGIKLVSKSNVVDDKYLFTLEIDGKTIYQRDDMMLEVKSVYGVTKTDFVVALVDLAEGFYTDYVLFYGDKHSSVDLSMFTKYSSLKDFKIDDIWFTIKSTRPYSFLDVQCLNHKEDYLFGAIEVFKYIGNGKVEFYETKEELTLLDIVKSEGYKDCKSLIE